jgi:hypothetical protein
MRVKPGKLDELRKMSELQDVVRIPGHLQTIVYQMDSNPDEVIMCVVFDSKDAYVKNANSPEQNARYQDFVALLEGAPEWNDGEVIYQM